MGYLFLQIYLKMILPKDVSLSLLFINKPSKKLWKSVLRFLIIDNFKIQFVLKYQKASDADAILSNILTRCHFYGRTLHRYSRQTCQFTFHIISQHNKFLGTVPHISIHDLLLKSRGGFILDKSMSKHTDSWQSSITQ